MQKNVGPIISNNIISIVLHAFISLLCFVFIVIVWEFGVWHENMSLENFIFNLSALGIYLLLLLFSYFWIGKRVLKKGKMFENILSVAGLFFVSVAILILGSLWSWVGVLLLSAFPVAETITHFLKLSGWGLGFFLLLFVLFLPSLMILAGMMSGQHRFSQKNKVDMPPELLFITNNLVAAATHIFICLILFAPIYFFLDGAFLLWKRGWDYVIIDCLAIGFFIIAALYLYYWAGKKFLKSTQNWLINSFSTVSIVILILGIMLLAYGGIFGEILSISLFPIAATLSYLFQIDEKYIYAILSPLLSLVMLAGMMMYHIKLKMLLSRKKNG